jgi:uncharacterized protein
MVATRDDILAILSRELDDLRQRFDVDWIAVFGSGVRSELREGSDIDVLVRLKHPATFHGYFDLKFRLEALLGREVDLVTEEAVRSELRPYVERDLLRVA